MIRGLKKAETAKRAPPKFSLILDSYFGLGDQIKCRSAELSGGEQQFLCLNISSNPWRTGIS